MGLLSGQRSQTALASATSSNGTARNGATFALPLAERGSLSVQCDITIVTGSVVCTTTPQVSMDGTTWYDVKLANNAATVTTAATATIAIQLADLSGWRFFRVVMTLSGAATAAGDLTAATYRFVRFGYGR